MIIWICVDAAFYGGKDTKTLLDRDALEARYRQHAPSSMDLHTVKHIQFLSNDDGLLFRCDRPLTDTLLGLLLHSIFGEFENNSHNLCLQTRDDHAFVKEFCKRNEPF